MPARIYDIEPYTGAANDLDEVPPPASSTGTTPLPQGDGRYILTQHDKDNADYTWDRTTKAQRRTFCARVGDGITDAELEEWMGVVEEQGIPLTEEMKANFRARFENTAATYC